MGALDWAPPAHFGSGVESWGPGDLDPIATSLVLAGAVAYGFTMHALSLRGSDGALPTGMRISFWFGLAVLAAAVCSPLEAAAGETLSAHMVQHVLIISIAAPLLAYGLAPLRLVSVFPRPVRSSLMRAGRAFSPARRLALVALLLAFVHALVVWAWHVPALYDAAVTSPVIHAAEHGAFLLTAVAIWGAVAGFGARIGPNVGILLILFGLAAQGALLGVIMAFSPEPWYASYAGGTDALADQQRAGLIMWSIGAIAPVLVVSLLIGAWIQRAARFPKVTRPVADSTKPSA